MLDVMRSNAKSSLIALIFGAIIVTFIFSFGRGSSGFRTRTPETWAARVNGDLVTAGDFAQAYSNRFRQMSQMRGGKYTTENAKQAATRMQTLLQGDMTAQVRQLQTAGAALADPNRWDGPLAQRFRSSEWPQQSRSLQAAPGPMLVSR